MVQCHSLKLILATLYYTCVRYKLSTFNPGSPWEMQYTHKLIYRVQATGNRIYSN